MKLSQLVAHYEHEIRELKVIQEKVGNLSVGFRDGSDWRSHGDAPLLTCNSANIKTSICIKDQRGWIPLEVLESPRGYQEDFAKKMLTRPRETVVII